MRGTTTGGLTAALLATAAVATPQLYGAAGGDDDLTQFVSDLDLSSAVAQNVTATLKAAGNSSLTDVEKASLACYVSSAAFGGEYLDASSANYTDRVDVNWSEACWQESRCIIEPSSTKDVSRAIRIVGYLESKFAVRSGGHNPNVGFASVDEHGVLIDMVNLNEITLNDDQSVVSVGPGNRFGAVYEKLNSSGLSIVGGRITDVGVGGYMLGGGMAFFSSQYGMAADNIKSFEVVLANSSIVEANAESNSDLYWALKGGGPNFGVVTKFDVNTIPSADCWFEGRVYAPNQTEKLFEAVIKYSAAAENDTSAGLVFNVSPDGTILGFVYGKPVEKPDVYSMFYDIPYTQNYINSTLGNTYELALAFADVTDLSPARRQIVSIAHKYSLESYKESYATYLNLSSQVTSDFNGSLAYGVQPFTSAAVKQSQQRGGNPLNLTDVSQDWFTATIQWEDAGDDEAALNAIQALGESVRVTSEQHGAGLPLRFMNDANLEQNVLGSYGAGNLARLRDISEKYDPQQLFQTLQNNGYLLSKA
ncbi:fad linked oxidase-like protein [Diplodia corticola]|uniref:Fad linked oxidase-like protein n=1 Tax=Diplodia corticola TaxID=236234 RepID=A0A1J9S970_9PEZI|nr:fad linked oxidase-like protein [Diplodia corticola]OJD36444.1 fad linked oxidase-like protein [Diplodia corticola]